MKEWLMIASDEARNFLYQTLGKNNFEAYELGLIELHELYDEDRALEIEGVIDSIYDKYRA